jgi:hypothetical protein
MFVSCVCCLRSGVCDELSLVQRSPTGCVCLPVCDLETSTMRRSRPDLDCSTSEKNRELKT